jgi:ribosomal protein L16/L10AE
MLLPKRVKYRRVQRGRMKGKAMRGNTVCQGQYGLVASSRRGSLPTRSRPPVSP